MANVPNSFNKESIFIQTDYVLLISTICGFFLVFISLIAIFIGRRLISQNSNNAVDTESQSSANLNLETRKLISKSPLKNGENLKINKEIDNSLREDSNILPSDDDYIDLDNFIIKNDGGNDARNNEEQYDQLNEGLFRLLYPQLASCNIFNSSKPSPKNLKPSISIQEITSDEETIFKENPNNDTKVDKETTKRQVFNPFKGDEIVKEGDEIVKEDDEDLHKNPFGYESPGDEKDNSKDDEKSFIHKSEIDRSIPKILILKTSDEEQKTDFNSFFEDSSNEKSIDSEEDSRDEIVSCSKMSKSSSSFSETETTKVQSSTNVMDKLLIIKSPPKTLNPLETDESKINNELNLQSTVDQLHVSEKIENEEIGTKMSERVESLQKDISTFLQRSMNFEEISNDSQEKQLGDDLERQNCESEIDYRDVLLHHTPSFIENDVVLGPQIAGYVQDLLIKSAGDNIHQDDLLIESYPTTTSTSWPVGNYDQPSLELLQRLGTSSESVNNQTSSIIDFSEERLPAKNYPPESIFFNSKKELKIGSSGNRFDDKNFDFSFPLPLTLNNFGCNQENINSDENIKSEGIKSKEESIDIENSRNSADNNIEEDCVLQTNKNASSDGEVLAVSTKEIRKKRNVQETVKLFEKAASKAQSNEFRTSLRVHKKHK